MPNNKERGKKTEIYESFGRRLKFDYHQYEALVTEAKQARAHWQEVSAAIGNEHDPRVYLAKLKFENANDRVKIFDLKHDPTGTKKKDHFGQDLVQPMKEALDRQPAGETYLAGPEDMITPMFIVNLGELDRLNSTGTHNLGDKGLGETALHITQVLETAGLADAFDIYRLTHNDFSVRLKKPITKKMAMDLCDALTVKVEDSPLKHKLPGGVEPPPSVADFIGLEEIAALLPEEQSQGEDRATKGIGALKDFLFVYNDISKTVQRFKRLRDKLQKSAMNEEEAKKNEAEAKVLFDNFLKKSLAGPYGVEDFAGFKKVVEKFDGDDQKISSLAIEFVLGQQHEKFKGREAELAKLTEWVLQKVSAEKEIELKEEVKPKKAPGKSYQARPEEGEKTRPFVVPNKETATAGLLAIRQREAEFKKLKEEAELEKLRNAAKPTDPIAAEIAEQELIKAENNLEIERESRDTATGFEQRGSMFKFLEGAYESKQANALVYADLSFLKYFNNFGGKETGDLAILKFAELMDRRDRKYKINTPTSKSSAIV